MWFVYVLRVFHLQDQTLLVPANSSLLAPRRLPCPSHDGFHFAQALIKRVIAVGGDSVQIKSGSLFVNGQEQFEDYTFEVRCICSVCSGATARCFCRLAAAPAAVVVGEFVVKRAYIGGCFCHLSAVRAAVAVR